LLVLFTDGISDARNTADERLGEERVLEVIAANRALPTADILEEVFTMLRGHITNVRIRDDLTLVVLRS
jgi:serine phosphatase RsbU (regulator of sigma subunit)